MIGAPLALIGLVAVLVPVVIHLLGRQQARVLRFPTLRFVSADRVPPTSRRRITDWPLLIVRALIVGLAAIALARPVWRSRADSVSGSGGTTRAIIVDTSASVRLAGGSDSGSRAVEALGAAASARTIIRTDDPADAIPGAVEWLSKSGGRGELVVISDFQESAIDSLDFVGIPAAMGVKLIKVGSKPANTTPIATTPVRVELAASPEAATILSRVARIVGAVPARDSALARIVIGRPAAVGRLTQAGPARSSPAASWILRAVMSDSVVRSALRSAVVASPIQASAAIISRNDSGDAVLGFSDADGVPTFWLATDADGLLPAAVLSAIAAHGRVDPLEADPRQRDAPSLAHWERAPSDRPARNDDESDGRYLWMAALALLILETWMRRHKHSGIPASSPGQQDRPTERAA